MSKKLIKEIARYINNFANSVQEIEFKLKEVYWKGFEDGKKNSLKHNIVLMKSQLNAQKEIK